MPAANPPNSGSMKKVLIITYYWPPSGGAGVQRWLKFVKYLREFGWEPIVYTPENPEPPDYDETLLADIPENLTVIRRPVWEPYSIYKRFTGQKKSTRISHGFLKEDNKQGFAEKLAVWVRGNFFIPDARCFWIRPSVKFLSNYLRKNPVDAIVSSGPPHSMHMIALGLKKKLDIPWLADFRDPWTEIDFFDKLRLTKPARNKHRKLERAVLTSADVVVAIGNHLAERLQILGAQKVEVIPNGYDEDDFNFLPVEIGPTFSITHVGSLNKDRNPENLWKSIASICVGNEELNQKLRLRFIGKVDFSLKESLAKYGLEKRTEIIPYLPHQEALKLAASSSVLLLIINQTPNQQGILTGKIFEYIAMHRPVLCIGPVYGEASGILTLCNSGETFGYDEEKALEEWIIQAFKNYKDGNLGYIGNKNVSRFSRKYQTAALAQVLNLVG
jgi:glycosyltransferase involved in cell wall biosynthesis